MDKPRKIKIDVKDIGAAGFDKYLNRTDYGRPETPDGAVSRYSSVRNLSGGLLSNKSRLYMGNQQMWFDGGLVKQVVHDGAEVVVIIGKLP